MVWSSQGPVCSPSPYCEMFTSMVPILITKAGMKSDSVGWMNEDLKVSGHQWNRIPIIAVLNMNRKMLKRKMVHPIAYSPGNRNGSGIEYLCVSVLCFWAAQQVAYNTFAIPPVAMVMVYQLHVKCLILSLSSRSAICQ